MGTHAVLICKTPSLKDTHLFHLKEFRTQIQQTGSAIFTDGQLFPADL